MHKLLEQQLRARFGSLSAVPPSLAPLLDDISAAYDSADEDRALLERAMELSSEELVKRNIELTAAYERLRELDSFRTQFINNAAHELGTPLTPIKIQLHLLKLALQEQGTTSPGSVKSLALLEKNLERLGELVRDVLDAAKLQAARFKLEVAPFDVMNVIADAVDAYRPVADQAGVHLEAPARGGAPLLALGDARRVAQVMYNFLSNALKFTPRGGDVRVRVETHGKEVVVSVADSGAGIPHEKLGVLFQPFTQVHDTMQQTQGGTGLGLYISRGIVEGCGGRIWAQSPGAGKGSTFAFALTLA